MSRSNGFLLWTALAVAVLLLLNLPVTASRELRGVLREALAPLYGAVSGLGLRLREAVDVLRGLGGHAAENRRLAEEVTHLRRQLRELSSLEAENETLRALLGFQRAAERPLLAARVIARDAAGWWQSVRIDRGARDGVRPDLAVITTEGLVGRVVETSARTADVLLISDPNCRVAARLPRAEADGVLVGLGVRPDGLARCRLDFIHRHLEIRPGDEAVTSGLGGVYPAGLPIGYIERVQTDEQGLYRTADVLPHADLGRLRYVFVVMASADVPRGKGAP